MNFWSYFQNLSEKHKVKRAEKQQKLAEDRRTAEELEKKLSSITISTLDYHTTKDKMPDLNLEHAGSIKVQCSLYGEDITFTPENQIRYMAERRLRLAASNQGASHLFCVHSTRTDLPGMEDSDDELLITCEGEAYKPKA